MSSKVQYNLSIHSFNTIFSRRPQILICGLLENIVLNEFCQELPSAADRWKKRSVKEKKYVLVQFKITRHPNPDFGLQDLDLRIFYVNYNKSKLCS
jgi:hypothetical protein